MCCSTARLVGVSRVPAVMLISSRPDCFQNRLPPQTPQNPRSAVSDDLYQRSGSEAVNSIFADGALVMAAECPLVRRYCAQVAGIAGILRGDDTLRVEFRELAIGKRKQRGKRFKRNTDQLE